MKFNNQSTFNGHQITNVVDRPVLHKKGKQWITVGLSTLLLAGLGAFTTIGNGVHASTNTVKANLNQNLASNAKANQPVNNIKNNQQNTNTKNITNQANDLHQRILVNQSAFQHQATTATQAQSNSSSNVVSKGLRKVASVGNADKISNYNTLNLGTPAQQKRNWNYLEHGVNDHDFNNTPTNSGANNKVSLSNAPKNSISANNNSNVSSNIESAPKIDTGKTSPFNDTHRIIKHYTSNNPGVCHYKYYSDNVLYITHLGSSNVINNPNSSSIGNLKLPDTKKIIINLSSPTESINIAAHMQEPQDPVIDISNLNNLESIQIMPYTWQSMTPGTNYFVGAPENKQKLQLYKDGANDQESSDIATTDISGPMENINLPTGTWYTSPMITPTYNYNDWFTNKSIKSNDQGNPTTTPTASPINDYNNVSDLISNGNSNYTQSVLPTDIVHHGTLSDSKSKYVINNNGNMKVGSGALTKSDITSLNKVINDNKVNSVSFVSNNGNPNDSTSLNKNVFDLSKAFANNSDLKSIDFGNNFDTSNVNHMMGMFANDNNLNAITFGNEFNTMKANQPSDLNDSNISWIKSWKTDTKNVNGELGMFANDNKLQTLNGSNNNTKFASDALKNQSDNISAPQNWVNSNNQPIELFSINAPALSFTAKATTPAKPNTPNQPSNQNETDEIRFELANGHEDEGQVAVQGKANDKWNNSNIAQYVPNGFSLDSNQQFIFGSYNKSDGTDNTDPYSSKRYHVIYVNPNDSNVPIKQNSVDINGNIVLHFGNSDVRVPLSFSAQNYPSGNVINLLKNTAYGDKLNNPADVNKLNNIDGSTVNPKLFTLDTSKSNDSVNYRPSQSDVKYVHGSTGYIYKNINLYFKAVGTKENINYITPNNAKKGNTTINGNANSKESTNSLNVPNGYSISTNNPSDVVINGGSSNINIVPKSHNINIKFSDGGKQLPNSDKTSGNTGSDIKPSSDKVPNGYHLVPGQHYTVPSDNNQSDNTTFNVEPNEEDKVVDYYYNQNGKNIFAGETHLQGNYDSANDDIKSGNTPGLDTGYQLVNSDNNIDFKDGKTEEIVPVEPIKQDAKYQFITPEGNGSKVNSLTNVSDKGSGNPSDSGIPVSSLTVPANYHLVNTNQRIHYDDQVSDIIVAPNTVNETIQFKDGKNIITNGKNGKPTKVSGLYGSNGTYANQNIPSDYHITNDGSENFNFNNGTATVDVTKNSPNSVVGVATITTNYEIAGHPNETKSVKHLVPISGSIGDTPVTLYANNWSKNGFNNSDDKNNGSWTINFDQNDVNNNGGNLRYHVDHTFNYIAKPVDVQVKFTDTTKDASGKSVNQPKGSDDLGTIGIPGQYMDIQDDGDGKVDALTGDGLFSNNDNTHFRLPVGYHLANANNNDNNKPASDNGGSVAPANIPNTPNVPSQPSDNINPVHFSDNNNPIIPNDNININIPSSSANNSNKASSASASNNNVAPASNDNNIFVPNSDVKPAHHNIKRVNNVNNIKIGQTANYHGLKITNITNRIHYFYVYNIKGIQLHHNLFKVGRENRHAVSVSAKRGFTGRILRYLRVNGKLRYEVRHNHKNYFVTANPKFVRNAYYQPREFKRATKGLLPHVRIQLRKTAQLYKSVHYSKRTHVGTLRKGKKATVVGIKKIGRKGYQQTRLVLSNGLIITANKNYVKFI